jgi:hypothetical protein
MEHLDVVSREPSNLLQQTQPFSGSLEFCGALLAASPCHQWLWHKWILWLDNLIRASELSFTDSNKIQWLSNFISDNWINIGCWCGEHGLFNSILSSLCGCFMWKTVRRESVQPCHLHCISAYYFFNLNDFDQNCDYHLNLQLKVNNTNSY